MLFMLFIYLFLQTLEFIYFICKSFVSGLHTSLAIFFLHFFFSKQFQEKYYTCAFLFSFFVLHFFFFSLESRSQSRRWTRFYHFTSLNNLILYQHFTIEIYIFLLIFVATISNIKSQLAFHIIIVHPTEVFQNEQGGNVLVNWSILKPF